MHTEEAVLPLLGQDIITDKTLLSELRISAHTLFRLNQKRQGPPRIRVGKRILYSRESVVQWLKEQEQRQTPERTPRRRRAA